MHTGNIFVKPRNAGVFGSNSRADPRRPEDRNFATFAESEYPNVVLADFDAAFFDLQQPGDTYQDNPMHYVMHREDQNAERQGGRNPPESFWQYQTRTDGPDGANLTRFTSATDVWGVGAIMWNLAMNLPSHADYAAPFFDDHGSHSGVAPFRRLNNGQPYDAHSLRNLLMTGDRPFEASAQYSAQLRDAIRECLRYHPSDRIGIRRLKRKTEKFRRTWMARDGGAELVVGIDGRLRGFRVGARYEPLAGDGGVDDSTV